MQRDLEEDNLLNQQKDVVFHHKDTIRMPDKLSPEQKYRRSRQVNFRFPNCEIHGQTQVLVGRGDHPHGHF